MKLKMRPAQVAFFVNGMGLLWFQAGGQITQLHKRDWLYHHEISDRS